MSNLNKIYKINMKKIGLGFSVFLMAAMANASEVGSQPMPWEGPLQKIMDSISGPVAQTLGVIVIVLAGLGIAFGESGSGVRKILMVVCGLAIAFTASSIVASLYSPSSGLSF